MSLDTVTFVDLVKYAGTWYEIARLPNRFQRKCARNTTAEYRVRADGKIAVINRCMTDSGRWIEARGVARVVDATTNAKLKVSFVRLLGFQLFWGDYWIIGLADDYSWAVVGVPGRKYGWILSREPHLDRKIFRELHALLQQRGYDPRQFERTPQVWPS
ncbi:lipocalin family protein [Thermodesulforhabdus norvegica]|uniref:Apolipoprotein D and lipocalin family protein n=1 Tax=Thermodesulforhabdus norvegica TaxID=39841 RepID=A0A1I4URB8_9BACT|nr:lipocalin family protein [Thermodesulforhabdus norvegica]SFM91290.1 apolipoprotein D and lipocalin family protein [Thermodesulforhabdus norvegica]